MLDEATLKQIEDIVRRVTREELAKAHPVPSSRRPPSTAPGKRRAHGEDDEGVRNVRESLAYLRQIDPDGRLPKREAADLVRLRFPHFS